MASEDSLTNLEVIFKKKTNIATELLETEKTYVNNLILLNKIFLVPLEDVSKSILQELHNNLHLIASVIRVVLSYHEIILNKIDERMKNWSPTTKLGDIFMEMSSFLKAYTQYVTHYQPTLRLLRARKDDTLLQNTLKNLIVKECRGKGLKDFLIMPIQRIPRYNMMLIDLVKKTSPDHCDYENLVEASEKIEAVCEHIEEMSDHAEKMEKKMELAAKIIFPKDSQIVLALPHRKYSWEDNCTVTTNFVVHKGNALQKKKVILFTFSDIFIFCESISKSDQYKAILYVELEQIDVFRALKNSETQEIEALIFTLKEGRLKIEDISCSFGNDLENFFLELANNDNNTEDGNKRRTVQIKQSSDSASTNSAQRVRAETTNVSQPTRPNKLSRTLSSKSLKRTLSVGKINKSKIVRPDQNSNTSNEQKTKSFKNTALQTLKITKKRSSTKQD